MVNGTTTASVERTKGNLGKTDLADLIDPLNPMRIEEVLARGWDYRQYLDALGRARAKWNAAHSEAARRAAEAERQRLENERIVSDSRWESLYQGISVSCRGCGHATTLFAGNTVYSAESDPTDLRLFHEGENLELCVTWRCTGCAARGVLSLGSLPLGQPPRTWIGLSIVRRKIAERRPAHPSLFRRREAEG